MNMFLHEFDQADIRWCDTIRNPLLVEERGGQRALMRFDLVVANPPFSLDKWGDPNMVAEDQPFNRFQRGVPPKSRGDYAFISHMVETAKPKSGRVGVVCPHGVLFRGGKEGLIRQSFIDENLLDAVIGLPPNLFYGTGIPAVILIFDKSRTDRGVKNVLFIDASREFSNVSKQNKLRDEDIEKITKSFLAREDIEKYAHVTSPEEIAENDYNLNIPRYVDTFEEEEPIDLAEVKDEIEQIESELAEVRAEMDKYLSELGL
jgi:type I restriction enzyme M protein